jgi:hypothetical protein
VTATDTDKAIFGDVAEEVANVRGQNPGAEDLAKRVMALYADTTIDTPAADLFKRRRYSDLLSVIAPGISDSYRYDFVMACLKYEVAETNNHEYLYDLIDHAMQDDAVNEIVQLVEARRFDELIDKLCPKADKHTHDALSRGLRDAMLDQDKLAEELDKDIARGTVSASEVVEQIIHGLYLSPQDFFASAGADVLQRLFPNMPKDFMADCMRALRLKLVEGQREVVYTVTETKFVQPPPPADEVVEAKVWDHAKTYIEKIAMLAKPLTGVGLDSATVMQTIWQALGGARTAVRHEMPGSDTSSFPEFSGPDPRVAQHFGTTILDKGFFFNPPDGDE